ncbi:MAG: hypothetical protein ACI9IO_001634 [Cyanobium sp.]|jgi:hypothetical protein
MVAHKGAGHRQRSKPDRFHISFYMAMAARQWRDLQWQRRLGEAYAALNEAEADPSQTIQPPDALVAAREAAALSPLPA